MTAAATWPASQVLSPDALRGAVSDDFSVELTVLSTSCPQSKGQVPHPAPGFNPREAARDPLRRALERLLSAGTVYAVTCGHRMISSLHTPMVDGGRARFHSALTADRARRTYATRRGLVGRVR